MNAKQKSELKKIHEAALENKRHMKLYLCTASDEHTPETPRDIAQCRKRIARAATPCPKLIITVNGAVKERWYILRRYYTPRTGMCHAVFLG